MTSDYYYDNNARDYFDSTVDMNMEPLYERFLPYVPAGGTILDAGCGSGRDTKAFLRRGYVVTAMDASAEMARLASTYTGLLVHHLRFEEMEFACVFDSIWASASLLHVPRARMHAVLERLIAALKPGGICYMSFKLGDGERTEGGRYFNDQNEETLTEVLSGYPNISIVEMWTTHDLRVDRADLIWLNCIIRKSNVH
jgi:SAM-dependent methyltransferase